MVDAKEGRHKPKRRSLGAERHVSGAQRIRAPHERTFKSSTSKTPTEREDRLIQNGQTDHLRLQVAVKRGTLLSGETKDDEVHRGSDAHGVFESRVVVLIGNGIRYMLFSVSVSVFFCLISLRCHNIQNGSQDQDPIGLQKKKIGVRDRNTETFCQR